MGAAPALCAALACMTGRTEAMSARSLLSNSPGFVTMTFRSDTPMEHMGYCWRALKRTIDPFIVETIRGIQVRRPDRGGWEGGGLVGDPFRDLGGE